MVFISLELSLANPLIYAHQHFSWDVLPIIHSCQEMGGKEQEGGLMINSQMMNP